MNDTHVSDALAKKEFEGKRGSFPRGARGESSAMATLWRAWRVVARRRGRPFADGLTVPSSAATEAAAEARVARAKAEAVKTNVSHAGYVTGTRILGHHRGAPTMAYAVELHVTPDIVAHPPGGACDVLVGVCDGDGTHEGDGARTSVTRWETDAYDFAVSVPRPNAAASEREKHAGLVAAYTSALDAAWGIGVTHFVDTSDDTAEHAYGRDREEKKTRPSKTGLVVAVPFASFSDARPSASAALSHAARAAAEAVSAYVPPPHIAARDRGVEWNAAETSTLNLSGDESFAVRFAAPSDAAASVLERELETLLGQHYAFVKA